MGARQGDARTALGALNAHDVGADAVTVAVGLAGDLFPVRQDGLKVVGDLDHCGASRARSLDGARDDLPFASREVAEHALVVGVAQALHDDGARGRLGDATEVLRGVIELADGVAVFVLVHGHDGDASGLLVDFDAGLGDGSGQVVIRLEQGFFDGVNEGFEADALLVFHHPQCGHIDFHGLLLPRSKVDAGARLPHVRIVNGSRFTVDIDRCTGLVSRHDASGNISTGAQLDAHEASDLAHPVPDFRQFAFGPRCGHLQQVLAVDRICGVQCFRHGAGYVGERVGVDSVGADRRFDDDPQERHRVGA